MSQQYPQDPDPRRRRPAPWPQQQPAGYSQNDFYSPDVQPNVQRHIPPQWQGKPGYRGNSEPPQWTPPVIEPYRYQVDGQPQSPVAPRNPGRPPYPSHLIGFPAELIGFGGSKRRGGGMSFWRMVYLGTHPIALLMSVFLIMFGIELWMMWLLLVLTIWLLWVMAVTTGWACHVAVSAMRGGRGRI